MIDSPLLSWLLTALFTGTTLWCAWSLISPPSRLAASIDTGWHALMGIAMIAMIWPWGMALSSALQVGLFAIGCAWFLGRAAFGGHEHAGAHPLPWMASTHHAAGMAGMAWMVASMPLFIGTTEPGSGGHHHALGGGGTTPMAQSVSAEVATAPSALTAGHAILGVVFIALCLPWLSHAFDLGRRLPDPRSPALARVVADCACHAAMSFGMGAMFLAMAG